VWAHVCEAARGKNLMIRVGMHVVPTPALALGEAAVAEAESGGLHSVWLPDHLMASTAESVWPDIGNVAEFFPSPHIWLDPIPVIAAWAQRANTVRFGTAVTDTFRRPPAVLAATSLTLSHLTEGRFVLGIGAGGALNTTPYGMPFERPVARLEEALEIIRRLWVEQRLTYEGRFWTLRDAVCKLPPYGGKLPEIWIGAEGPRMLDLVGRYGDGWIPWVPTSPESYAERLEIVRRAAERAGRDPLAITPSLNAFVLLADDHEIAHRMLVSEGFRQMAIGFDTQFFAREGIEHPLGTDSSGLVDFVPEWASAQELRAILSKLPDRPLGHEVVLHGTPAEVAAQLTAFGEAGLRHVIVGDLSPLCDITQMQGMPARVAELARLLAKDAVTHS
jgi:phthiodiolone/phenolphthiodiolone dimycocerosates ketoreductase